MLSSIPSKFSRDYSDTCSKSLTDIINDGILNTYFDIGLKYADLTPVDKAEETTNKKNYRNTSLLPALSKIFEKLLHTQIAIFYVVIEKAILHSMLYLLCWSNGESP